MKNFILNSVTFPALALTFSSVTLYVVLFTTPYPDVGFLSGGEDVHSIARITRGLQPSQDVLERAIALDKAQFGAGGYTNVYSR